MPRGVAIPEVRQQLFAAAEQVIVRDGADGLSGRAVTREAGVATGLLYAHFADLDDFLAGYAVDRVFVISAPAATLTGRAGTGTVAENLTNALVATQSDALIAHVRLQAAKPGVAVRVRAVLGDSASALDTVQNAIRSYLADEQGLDRIPDTADPLAIAHALVSVVCHRALVPDPPTSPPGLADVVDALVAGVEAGTPRRRGNIGSR